MNYIIIKVCCFSCDKFEDLYNIKSSPRDFITNLTDYEHFDFYIYENNSFYDKINGFELYTLNNKNEEE